MTARTTIPERPAPTELRPDPRPIATVSARDVLTLVGAAVSALATTLLLFGRLTPLSGKLGFVTVYLLVFIAVYAAIVSITDNRPAVVDRVMSVLLTSSAGLAFFALFSVIIFVLWRGREALSNANFFTEDLSITGPLDPLDMGGILHAVTGTLIMTSLSLVFTVPLGIACAVYLTETGSKSANLVRTVVTAMTALPSILAGLFIFATWILVLGYERSGLAASIAMSIMMLPIIIRSADVVLRLVPGNLREAAQALGAPKWRTVWHVVLPTARSGLTTSVILGVARGVGETAPVLLTAGFTSTLNVNPTSGPMVSLPLAAFELVRSPQPTQIARGFATAATLMVLVLVLFTIARVLGGRPAGHQSKRQAKSTRAASAADLERMTQRDALRQLAANGSADAGTSSGDPATEFDLIAEVLR
jgi:phosphate transport system permease protein